eukprot:SAG31_NODE_7275_length_1736_cov_4.816127_2_plen_205_part_00
MQLFEKYGTFIERNAALIENVSPCSASGGAGGGGGGLRPVLRPVLQARSFNLSDVRLIADADNHFAQAQELNTQFLKYLQADRLLYTFRTIAQLPQAPGAEPYGGWISPVGVRTVTFSFFCATAYRYSRNTGLQRGTDRESVALQRVELVNGHFTGHFLSALAFTAAATGDPAIVAKSEYLGKGCYLLVFVPTIRETRDFYREM